MAVVFVRSARRQDGVVAKVVVVLVEWETRRGLGAKFVRGHGMAFACSKLWRLEALGFLSLFQLGLYI